MMKRRVTATNIAEILGVSRTTVNSRLKQVLSADALITVCAALGINPTHTLVELNYLEYGEIAIFMDMDERRVDTADDGELALELARRLNPAIKSAEIDATAAHRSNVTCSSRGSDRLRYPALSGSTKPEEGKDHPRKTITERVGVQVRDTLGVLSPCDSGGQAHPIVLNQNLDAVNRLCVLAHELGHAFCGDKPTGNERFNPPAEQTADRFTAQLLNSPVRVHCYGSPV